jgi:sarcosine oxidase subunit alpha
MTDQPFRMPSGGTIDRAQRIGFTFGGRALNGCAGDTLASALLANGVRLTGRSFKYHRPRGIIGIGSEEPNALMQVGQGGLLTPNMRATEILLHDGLTASPVNCWPNVRFDVGGINNLLSRFLTAGFYYKTFMWPHWHFYEWAIRRAAGLGKVASERDPSRYEIRYAHADILVVGSGAAGLAAAKAAAEGGAQVILAEQDNIIGGQLLWDGGYIDGIPAAEWAVRIGEELSANRNVRILLRTAVTGYFDHNAITMIETVAGEDVHQPRHLPRYRQWELRAKRVILATGAIERPLVFSGNDRPGIMLAGAVRNYIGRYAVRPGDTAVIFTNNDEAYQTAFAFQDAGGSVAAVVDSREDVQIQNELTKALVARGINHFPAAAIYATSGYRALSSVVVRDAHGRKRRVKCDLLATSGGMNPSVHLFSQSGGNLRFDDDQQMFVPKQSRQAECSVGMAAGKWTLSGALSSGHVAGLEAARRCGFAINSKTPTATEERPMPTIKPCWLVNGEGKAFVDMQNDVTIDDIHQAKRENFVSVEHLKRYTTLGMAPDQGKTSNVNALAIMSQLTRNAIEETGTTRYRFPFVPTALGAFAGRNHSELLRPYRRLELHDWHVANGALIDDFGWERPAAYPREGETRHDAGLREALAVRQGVGLFDGSPLGKIEVRGPDASRFLDFIYANAMSTLRVGKVRYGLMLNELGVIMDDGVCARLHDDHFLVGTSSAGADRIAAWLEEWLQCEFVDYDVLVAPVTTSWAVITVTGPDARRVLQEAGTDIDLDAANFTHMSFRNGSIGGATARVFRVSYTGETSYEINVATSDARIVWTAIWAAGRRYKITPIGLDAWNALRLEKGFLHIGADTDGTTTPLNIGWDHVMQRADDFVGKRSLLLPVNSGPNLLQLVGLEAIDGSVLPIGGHLIHGVGPKRRSDGFVTSSARSALFGKGVAMGLAHSGRSRIGEQILVQNQGQMVRARILDAVRYDPRGERLRG